MIHVFINHSNLDRGRAEQIASALRCPQLIVSCESDWTAHETGRLNHLQRAKYVLVLLSAGYNESQNTHQTLEAAAVAESSGGTRIIPLVMEKTSIPAFLQDRTPIDLSTDFRRGIAAVKCIIFEESKPITDSARFFYQELIPHLTWISAALGLTVMAHFAMNYRDEIRLQAVIAAIIFIAGGVSLTALIATVFWRRRSRQPRWVQSCDRTS